MSDFPSQPLPRPEAKPAMGDWADALEAGRRPLPIHVEDWTRRRLALIAIVIALLFPFYQHFVQREIERAAEAAMQEAGQAAAASARQANVVRAERERQARIAAVRVVGVIEGNPPVVVVANLPPEGAAEVAERICAQAAAWLRRGVGGMPLRVNGDRGDRPGTDAGRVLCPPK